MQMGITELMRGCIDFKLQPFCPKPTFLYPEFKIFGTATLPTILAFF